MELPDLTLYRQGLDPASFPLTIDKVLTDEGAVEQVHVALVTLEGESVRIQLDTRGFHIIESSTEYTPPSLLKNTAADEITADASPPGSSSSLARQEEARSGFIYETIEALLMALSPQFEAYFGNELHARLEGIDWSQQASRWHQSDSESDEDERD